MNRTIQYTITEKDSGLRIEQFLRRRGYSGQNLAEIKRMPMRSHGIIRTRENLLSSAAVTVWTGTLPV